MCPALVAATLVSGIPWLSITNAMRPAVPAISAVAPPKTPTIRRGLFFFLITTWSSSIAAVAADFLETFLEPTELATSRLKSGAGEAPWMGGAGATGVPTGRPAGTFCGVVTTGGTGRPTGGPPRALAFLIVVPLEVVETATLAGAGVPLVVVGLTGAAVVAELPL